MRTLSSLGLCRAFAAGILLGDAFIDVPRGSLAAIVGMQGSEGRREEFEVPRCDGEAKMDMLQKSVLE